jgi:hypothetical protein
MNASPRLQLLELLQHGPRGSASQAGDRVRELILELEAAQPADLQAAGAPELLEGVWELRWSSSRQPYLATTPWLENLQLLAPSRGLALNLLRLAGPLGPIAAVAVEARIRIVTDRRVEVCFQRGGWLGPRLGSSRLQLLRTVQQPFAAWLDITVLDEALRVCRGNAGTLFALVRRSDLSLVDLWPTPF